MELLVLNTDFESIAVIDTYESMIWTDRYNSYGDFEIFFAMDTQLLQYLKEDYYLWLKDSEHCMIIEDIKINADTEEGNHLIVTGRSLELNAASSGGSESLTEIFKMASRRC